MTILVLIALAQAQAADLGSEINSYYNSYRTREHLQRMQMEKLSGLMDQVWQKSKEIDSLKKNEHYTTKSATLYQQLGELSQEVKATSQAFVHENMRVRMNATQAEDVVTMYRDAYFKKLENVAALDKTGLKSLNLSKEVTRDVEFVRATRDLPQAGRRQLFNQYMGRDFGQRVPLENEAKMQEMLKGVRSRRTVLIDTYHTTKSFDIASGQYIRLQTATGAIVQGEVMGVLPDDRVLIRNKYGAALEGIPGLDTGGARLVDLSKAKTLNVYSDAGRLSFGQADLELNVRLGQREITSAIKSDSLTTIARRKPLNGSYATRDRVLPTVIDKRAGEQIGSAVREGLGALMGLSF